MKLPRWGAVLSIGDRFYDDGGMKEDRKRPLPQQFCPLFWGRIEGTGSSYGHIKTSGCFCDSHYRHVGEEAFVGRDVLFDYRRRRALSASIELCMERRCQGWGELADVGGFAGLLFDHVHSENDGET